MRSPVVHTPAQHTEYDRRLLALALCLAALAGYVDALGVLFTQGLFVAFMSGNSTRLAVEIAQGHWAIAAPVAGVIAAFVLGTMIGQWLSSRSSAIELLAVGLLLASAVASQHLVPPVLTATVMAVAMGMENCALDRDRDVRISLTYVTGTLVKFGRQAAIALAGGDRWGWLPYILLWLSFSAGAVGGVAVYLWIGLSGLWAASAAALLLALRSYRARAP
jgi:uncharacterized membrane protein YoaK (UPF0700 family)